MVAWQMVQRGERLHAIWVMAELMELFKHGALPSDRLPKEECLRLLRAAKDVGGSVADGLYTQVYEELPAEVRSWVTRPGR